MRYLKALGFGLLFSSGFTLICAAFVWIIINSGQLLQLLYDLMGPNGPIVGIVFISMTIIGFYAYLIGTSEEEKY